MRASSGVLISLALSAALIAHVLAPGAVRAVIALPMALFIPGYVATKIAFPRMPLDLERLCFAVGLSIAFTVLCGFALHSLAMMTSTGWTLALGGVTFALMPFAAWPQAARVISLPGLSATGRLCVAAASVIAPLAMLQAGADYQKHKEFSYTELWMAPDRQAANVYVVGVTNREQRPARYDLEIVLGAELIGSWSDIGLNDGESWIRELQLNFKSDGDAEQRAEVRLHKRDDATAAVQKVWASMAPRVARSGAQISESGPMTVDKTETP